MALELITAPVYIAATAAQLADLMGELLDAQATDDGPGQRIGELAVARGYVTAEQITDALHEAATGTIGPAAVAV